MKISLLLQKGFMAGFFVALASILLSILSLFLPPAGCLWCIASFVPGVLAAYYVNKQSGSATMTDGAIAGAIAGTVCSILTLIVFDPFLLLLGGMFGGAAFFTDNSILTNMLGALGIGMIIGTIVGSFFATFLSAIVNAVTGLMYIIYAK